jgi:type VI secretion system protein ImpH
MDAKLGNTADALTFLDAVSREPYRYDFYQTLRRLECLYADKPLWGTALRPIDEAVRFGQEPELIFSPAPFSALDLGRDGAPPRLMVRLFGLLGPNGPLPLHITEYARERLRHAGDPALCRFLDVFHHRFIALFYRAWAQAQPQVNRDRPGQDRFRVYVGSFVGIAPDSLRDRDSVSDLARLFHSGTLVRQVRNAEGLAQIVTEFFDVKARVEEFVPHWLVLEPATRTRLGRVGTGLADGAVLGRRVWDRQSKFRLHLGPLTLDEYQSFLPATVRGGRIARDGKRLRELVDWVRFYLSFELDWDVRLHLKPDEVPTLQLGVAGQLGWTTWLGRRRTRENAADLILDGELCLAENRVAA